MYFLNEESEKTHYFNGELEGTNGSTTLFHEEGKNVYFEKNGDGQNIYFLKDGVKNYLYVDRVGASVNFAYSPTLPGISWMYDGVNGCISLFSMALTILLVPQVVLMYLLLQV